MYNFIIKKLENKVTIYDDTGTIELASYIDENCIRSITLYDDNCIKFSDGIVSSLIKGLYLNASKEGLKPICGSTLIQKFVDSTSYLVADIEPIVFDGEIDVSDNNALGMCIELPVRGACQKLNSMGITTLMSSANKNDVLARDEKIDQLSNYGNSHFNLGNGYAWIMIDWESLSMENKQKLILLNNGTITIELSDIEKQNLYHNCNVNNLEPSQKELIKFLEVFDYRVFQQDRSRIGHLTITSEEDAYFQTNRQGYACINSLCNHGVDYRVVVIRYPINDKTIITDVEKYFSIIINNLKKQKQLADNDEPHL